MSNNMPTNQVSPTADFFQQVKWSVQDAIDGLKLNKMMTIWTIITITLSLFLIAVFSLTSIAVNSFLEGVERQVTIYAFIDDDAAQEDVDAFKAVMESQPNVESIGFTTKDEAWEEYSEMMGKESTEQALHVLDGKNPLPASVTIKMTDASFVEDMTKSIIEMEEFSKIAHEGNPSTAVTYGKQEVSNVISFIKNTQLGMGVLVLIVLGVTYVLISNTIRNSIAARSEEIAIMKLVGADDDVIKRPFVFEGIIQTTIGIIITIAIIAILKYTVVPGLASAFSFLDIVIPRHSYLFVTLLTIASGLLLGIVVSLLSIRKYLEV